jgi:hypothetical protein
MQDPECATRLVIGRVRRVVCSAAVALVRQRNGVSDKGFGISAPFPRLRRNNPSRLQTDVHQEGYPAYQPLHSPLRE